MYFLLVSYVSFSITVKCLSKALRVEEPETRTRWHFDVPKLLTESWKPFAVDVTGAFAKVSSGTISFRPNL